MKQKLDSHPVLIRPDYNETLVLAIELSNAKWVLAAQVPGLANVKNKRTIEPTVEALTAAIASYRTRAAKTGRKVQRIIATYEAGWSGFWLARWLMRQGIETHVIQPSSVPVDRRARRAKSDGIDAELLLRTLLAWLRGEPRVCSMVPIPDEADEDTRRLVRERSELVKERIKLANRIGAVLATLGVPNYDPLKRNRRRSMSYEPRWESRYRCTRGPRLRACSTVWNWCSSRLPNWSASEMQ
jgi:transposase